MSMMPSNELGPPSYAKDKEAIWKEIHAIWRELKRAQPGPQPTETIFSFAGSPPEGQLSPPYQARLSAAIQKVMVGLGTAGSTASVVKVYLNNEEIVSVILEPSVQSSFVLSDVTMTDGDFITTAVTTVGSGALDFTVQVHWK